MALKGSVVLTGGAGYIGSHSCIAFSEAGYDVVIIDNLCNSSAAVLDRIEQVCGQRPTFYELDIRDETGVKEVLDRHNPVAVVHFAGLKAVGESVEQPLSYYENNVAGTLVLLRAMKSAGVQSMVFSSSATVYGDPATVPITESFPRSATNPYGRSKLIIEDMLLDLAASDSSWSFALLRYFNPVGAHESGLIGEDPSGIPNNLMPYVAQVAVGRRERLSVFGGDYPTPDGTGVRDYIHVSDLAAGHVSALEALGPEESEPLVVNLGTGSGYSVLELVRAFEKASGKPIPYDIVDRRPGDVAQCFADTEFARQRINWEAKYGIDRMCADAWRWQSMNPNGFTD